MTRPVLGRRRFVLAGASLVASAFALSACGTRTPESDSGTSGGAPAGRKVAKIGVLVPLSGGLSSTGAGVRNSVELAVREANDRADLHGWTLEVITEDDRADADTGRRAATQLTRDAEVVAVIGPLNSSVGQVVQPVVSQAGMALVSPANTNPTLTRGADSANPSRVYDNYFRTCPPDHLQARFAASQLLEQGIDTVATIHDKKVYGNGLVTAFTTAFTTGGGKVVAAQTINPDDRDFSVVVSKVKEGQPKAVFFGGEYPVAGPLSQQLKGAGVTVPLMGGDGIFDPRFIELAGPNAKGDRAVSIGAPQDRLASAKGFLEAYRKAGFREDPSPYGPYAYDAANAVITALRVALADAVDVGSARKPTIEELSNIEFDGATGQVSFDQYGDPTLRVLTAYKVDNGAWAAITTEEFS
ncbi:MAG: branched-chain amino acid ABC transporter substrate-binding protein [Propionibacteriaceae bacterium]|nr:branched-chain amino acid ABC transporter substrate-binding protein [Propionibacteriaceae bacterium]